jgi:hypothetical protein
MGYPLRGGLPHSEISGSPGARPSPELFAACHVLHRLSVPRHPPDALLVLAHAQPQDRTFPRCPGALPVARPYRGHAPRRICIPMPGHDRSTAQGQRPRRLILSCPLHGHDSLHDVKTSTATPPLFGARADLVSPGGCRRTFVLPARNPRLLVGLGRFERPTSRLSGVRSNQLSYRPGFRCQRSDVKTSEEQRACRTSALCAGAELAALS